MSFLLYLDEDSQDQNLVKVLRARGIGVLTVNEAGMKRRADPEQLEFAASCGRTIYTYNRADFCRLNTEWLTQGKEHWGIIVGVQGRFTVGEIARRLSVMAAARTAEDMKNRIEFLSSWT